MRSPPHAGDAPAAPAATIEFRALRRFHPAVEADPCDENEGDRSEKRPNGVERAVWGRISFVFGEPWAGVGVGCEGVSAAWR